MVQAMKGVCTWENEDSQLHQPAICTSEILAPTQQTTIFIQTYRYGNTTISLFHTLVVCINNISTFIDGLKSIYCLDSNWPLTRNGVFNSIVLDLQAVHSSPCSVAEWIFELHSPLGKTLAPPSWTFQGCSQRLAQLASSLPAPPPPASVGFFAWVVGTRSASVLLRHTNYLRPCVSAYGGYCSCCLWSGSPGK